MTRLARFIVLFFVCSLALQARPDLVKVHLRVIPVDRDLNQKPVPFLLLSLKSGAKSVEVKTGLDGTGETQLPPGKYTITTPNPAETGGRSFSWNLTVTFTGSQQQVDISNHNARAEEVHSSGSV